MIPHTRNTPETGVSESIGFMLIFTIIIAGIGLVTLYGYPMLMKQQVSADQQIMEKNMIVLQNDMKSLAYKTVPYKETSLKVGGGSLTVYNASTNPQVSTITIYDSTTSALYVDAFKPGDLRYVSLDAGVDISLQDGAVVKRPHATTGSVMIAEPRWFYDSASNTMIINLVSVNSSDIIARSGIGTVQMKLGETSYQYITPTSDVILEYTTNDKSVDYSTAWNNYFENTLKMERLGTSGNTISYRLPLDFSNPAVKPPLLVIKRYDIFIQSV